MKKCLGADSDLIGSGRIILQNAMNLWDFVNIIALQNLRPADILL